MSSVFSAICNSDNDDEKYEVQISLSPRESYDTTHDDDFAVTISMSSCTSSKLPRNPLKLPASLELHKPPKMDCLEVVLHSKDHCVGNDKDSHAYDYRFDLDEEGYPDHQPRKLFRECSCKCKIFTDGDNHEFAFQTLHGSTFVIAGRVIHEVDPFLSTIIIMDWKRVLEVFRCSRPLAPFMSPMLRWQNTPHFTFERGPTASINNVLQGTRPMVSTTFYSQDAYKAALDKVTASGFPFHTQPEQKLLCVAQPMTLGDAFDLEAWLQSFTVEHLQGNCDPDVIQLLSREDKACILLLRNYPLSHWLQDLNHPTATNKSRRNQALMDLLLGYPIECTISALQKLSP